MLRELLVKDYKELLKTTYGPEVDAQVFLANFNNLFKGLIQTKEREDFDVLNLSVEQLLLFLFDLRINTLGPTCKLVLTEKTKEDKERKSNVFFNLEHAKEDIKNHLNRFFVKRIEYNDLTIELGSPSLRRILESNVNPHNYENYFLCVKGGHLKSKTMTLNVSSNDLAKTLLETLPVALTSEIISFYKNYLSSTTEINFLSLYDDTDKTFLGVQLTLEAIIYYTKLFFSEDLDVFYNNVFFISKLANINLSYLETECTPGEYLYFTRKLISSSDKQKNSDEPATNDVDLDE